MPIYEFEGRYPSIHPTAFVAPTAAVIGDVTIGPGSSIWFGAVIRADFSPIAIGSETNVQDGSVIHGPPDFQTIIGSRVTIAHLCLIHGATLGDDSTVANGATILDGASVGAGAVIAAHSLVPGETEIPPNTFAAGVPAAVIGPADGNYPELGARVAYTFNRDLGIRYATGLRAPKASER